MRGLRSDHGISGPMRGLQKTASYCAHRHTDRHTGGHCDSKTESAHWADSVKMGKVVELVGGGFVINGAALSIL